MCQARLTFANANVDGRNRLTEHRWAPADVCSESNAPRWVQRAGLSLEVGARARRVISRGGDRPYSWDRCQITRHVISRGPKRRGQSCVHFVCACLGLPRTL